MQNTLTNYNNDFQVTQIPTFIESTPLQTLKKKPLQVSEITLQLKSAIESDFSYVEVEGEISGFTLQKSSGHIYFSLKDSKAILACTFFRGAQFKCKISNSLKNGDKIIAKGKIQLYEPKGTYALNIFECEFSGAGDLQAQLLALKNEFEKKGYFDNIHKKPLPRFPKRIIFLTSASGAALQDMIKVASKRFCVCEFVLINTLVQGVSAKDSITRNIALADTLNADIIILARGGGSIEDLWCFNERDVIEAIYACKTPLVSAIGHEIDYLLSDYVADLRAPTPSAAMEMILPDKDSLMLNLMDLEKMLEQSFAHFIRKKKESFLFLYKNIELLNPSKKINLHKERLLNLQNALQDSINFMLNNKKANLKLLNTELSALKPTNKLVKIRTNINLLNENLNEKMQQLLRTKKGKISELDSNLRANFKVFLTQKRTLLNIDMSHNLISFLGRKRSLLNSFEQILKNINPQNRVQKGFVQILKDNKIMQISELKSGDKIELVDSSGIAGAIVE